MKKSRGKHSSKEIGRLKLVDDFLPKPKDLILKKDQCASQHPPNFLDLGANSKKS